MMATPTACGTICAHCLDRLKGSRTGPSGLLRIALRICQRRQGPVLQDFFDFAGGTNATAASAVSNRKVNVS